MMKRSFGLALALAALASAPAAYAQGTFTPGTGTTSNCNIGNSGTATDTKTCSVGSVSVTMTAWGYTGNTLGASAQAGFTQGLITDWDTSGIGVASGTYDSTYNSQHAFDNLTSGCGNTAVGNVGSVTLSGANNGCGGSIEGLLLNFGSSKVNLSGLTIGWWSGDADLMLWAWTGTGTPTMSTQTAAGSTTTTGTTAASLAGWSLVGSNDMDLVNPFNPTGGNAGLYSSYFLVTTYFGAAATNLTAGDDRFKLSGFTASLCSGTLNGGNNGNGSTCTPGGGGSNGSVPEPGSLALAGLAMMGAVATRRKLKSSKRAA